MCRLVAERFTLTEQTLANVSYAVRLDAEERPSRTRGARVTGSRAQVAHLELQLAGEIDDLGVAGPQLCFQAKCCSHTEGVGIGEAAVRLHLGRRHDEIPIGVEDRLSLIHI